MVEVFFVLPYCQMSHTLLRHVKNEAAKHEQPQVEATNELVCCQADLEKALEKVKSLDGPNVVYCKEENKVYYHRKDRVSRMKKAFEMEDPYGDVPKFILKAMHIANKHHPGTIPKIVRL